MSVAVSVSPGIFAGTWALIVGFV